MVRNSSHPKGKEWGKGKDVVILFGTNSRPPGEPEIHEGLRGRRQPKWRMLRSQRFGVWKAVYAADGRDPSYPNTPVNQEPDRYPVKLLLKNEGKIKTLPDKQWENSLLPILHKLIHNIESKAHFLALSMRLIQPDTKVTQDVIIKENYWPASSRNMNTKSHDKYYSPNQEHGSEIIHSIMTKWDL